MRNFEYKWQHFWDYPIKMVIAMSIMLIWVMSSYAQSPEKQISLECNNEPLAEVLKKIEKSSGFKILFTYDEVQNYRVSASVNKRPLTKVLQIVLRNTPLKYTVKGHFVNVTLGRQQPQIQKGKNHRVLGNVYDSNNEPLIGATVKVEGSNIATITDIDGHFSIDMPTGEDNLQVSYIGMESRTVSVGSKNSIRIHMKEEQQLLKEVVVTGYQTISKERATGAFDILSGKKLENPSVDISQRLVGKIAGVQTGIDADGNVSMVIRGQGTFLGSSPLIVVDGFATTEGLSSVNPNDVESVTVLKDAAAASIWGARASNGVVVVTTKKAKKNKGLKVDFSTFVKISSNTDLDYLRNYASSADEVEYEKQIFGKYGYTALASKVSSSDFKNAYYLPYTQAEILYNKYANGEISQSEMNTGLDKLKTLDNSSQIKKYLLRRPVYQQYNLSLSGSTDRMTNYVSLMYSYDSQRFKKDSSDNLQFDYRGQMNVFKWLDINLSAMMRYNRNNNSGATTNMIKQLGPYDMLMTDDGKYTDLSNSKLYTPMITAMVPQSNFPYSDWTYNPIQEINSRSLKSTSMGNRLQAGLTFKIIPGLSFDSKFQYERVQNDYRNLYNEDSWTVRYTVNKASTWDKDTNKVTANLPKGSFLDESRSTTESYDFRNQLNFDKTFFKDHAINFIAGFEISQTRVKSHTSPRSYGYDDEHLTVGLFPNGVGEDANKLYDWIGTKETFSYINKYTYNTDRYVSLYANLAYTYKGRYSLSGSVRNDASNFITDDPQYRYSPFWSVGASWTLSDEDFMKNLKFIQYLKLRATYGYNGNSSNATSVKPLITLNGINSETGYLEADVADKGNPLLRWEKTGVINIGLDFDMFGHRLYGKLDYYNKHGKDILAYVSVPMATGSTSAYFNNAEITNNGIELELGSHFQITKDLSWDGNLTFAYNKNRVKKLLLTSAPYWWLTGSGGTIYIQGKPINSLWSYRYGGVQNVGTATSPLMKPVVKLVGDEVMPFGGTTTYDGLDFCEYQGTSVAPYTLGMTHSFDWKDFDFSFVLTGEFGHVFRRTGFNYAGRGEYANAQLSQVINCNPSEIAPMPLNDTDNLWTSGIYGYLDYLTARADNVRLQEVTISYRLPISFLSKLSMTNASLYVQGNNLLTIKGTKEDPNYKYGTLRLMPSYILGLKVSF